MRRIRPALLVAVCGLAFLSLRAAPPAHASPPPVVLSVIEGRDTATDRPVLVLVGRSLTKFTAFRLEDPAEVRPAEELAMVLRAKTMVVLGAAADTPGGWYDLVGTFGAGETQTFRVCVTNRAPLPGAVSGTSLDPTLRTDLDDAATLAGNPPSYYCDAGNLVAGTVSTDRYSAHDDLVAEARVGPAASQVAAGDHDHDAAYPRKTDLAQAGTVNDASNPVDWTRLKNVPEGIADGTDGDTTYSAGAGLSLAGTTFSVSSVGWSQLTGVPAGFADGTDADAWTESDGNACRTDGKVGIGTSSPAAALHVAGDDGVLFGGTVGSGSIPATGAGVRMMWYPGKGAFRAGVATDYQWNDAFIGDYSMGLGVSSMASGLASTASGYYAEALGDYSTAFGRSAIASGLASTAMGFTATARGDYSVAMGLSASAWGNHSTAIGHFTRAEAYASLALGQYNVIAGSTSSWVSTDPVLVVGKGTSEGNRSNAFTLLKNGNLTIAGTLTQSSDERLKTEIAPLAGVLPRLEGIRGVSYRFRDEERGPEGRQIGLLAQEVREAFPELVREAPDGALSVSYGNFAAVLLEAVKEQQAVIEAKSAAIEALERRLERLEALVGAR